MSSQKRAEDGIGEGGVDGTSADSSDDTAEEFGIAHDRPKRGERRQPQYREKNVDSPIFRNSRDRFHLALKVQVPHPHDTVFWCTVPILEEYNSQSLLHQEDPLCIEALSAAPTSFTGCDTVPEVHLLTRHKLFIKIQLKLVRDLNAGWQAPKVMLRDDDRWISLQQWLHTLPKPRLSATGASASAYQSQFKWWTSMEKPFRFQDLPSELQKKILLFAIGPFVEVRVDDEYSQVGPLSKPINLTSGPHIPSFRACAARSDTTRAQPFHKVNIGLLYLDKATRKLALETLHGDTVKTLRTDFQTPTSMHLVQVAPKLRTNEYRMLRRVQLALGYKGLIYFFQIPLPIITDFLTGGNRPKDALVLRQLPHLREIKIFFESKI